MSDSGFHNNNRDTVKLTGQQRKYVAGLAIAAFLAVGAMMLGGGDSEIPVVGEVKPEEVTSEEKTTIQADTELAKSEQRMEEKLESSLSEIKGVGEVVVKVTLDSSPEYHYAADSQTNRTEVNEETHDGSTRVTNETQEDSRVVMKNMNQGVAEPVVVREISPEVVGVMVIAEGANQIAIKEQISDAVQTLLNISSHRVTVLPKESGE